MRLTCIAPTHQKPKIYLCYVSYPYSDNPKKRTQEVKEWAQKILLNTDDLILLIPHFVFDAVWDFPEGYTYVELGLLELSLIDRIDIFIYHPNHISTGVRWELASAQKEGIPCLTFDEIEVGKRP